MVSDQDKKSVDTPKVSVIIPFFNAEEFIEECIVSVIKQSVRDIEIICIDDGSTDGSLDIVNSYKNDDDRIIVIEKEHSNAGDARNEGLLKAKGEYLAFVDADDFVDMHMIEKAYFAAKEANADIIHFRCDMFDHNTKAFTESPWTLKIWEMPDLRPFSSSDVYEKAFNMGSCTPWDKLFKNSFIKKNNIRFQSIASSNDMVFTYGAISLAESITTLEDVLYHMRVGHNKTTAALAEDMIPNYYKALMELKDFLNKRGIYRNFEKSFLNWAADFSLWNCNRFRNSHFYHLIRQQLKMKYFDDLGVNDLAEEDYHNPDLFQQVSELKNERLLEMNTEKSKQPKVSVIIPVLNAESSLDRCFEGIIYQTLSDIEIICIDDGSSDNSGAILEKYVEADNRFKVFKNDLTMGHGSALNQGLSEAKGEYVCFVEPFDIVSVTMLEKLYKSAKENDLDIAKGDYCKLRHDKYGNIDMDCMMVALDMDNYNRIIDSSYDRIWRAFCNVPWSALYKTDFLFENMIMFNEEDDAPFIDDKFVFDTNIKARRVMYLPEIFYFDTVKSYLFSGYGMTELL